MSCFRRFEFLQGTGWTFKEESDGLVSPRGGILVRMAALALPPFCAYFLQIVILPLPLVLGDGRLRRFHMGLISQTRSPV